MLFACGGISLSLSIVVEVVEGSSGSTDPCLSWKDQRCKKRDTYDDGLGKDDDGSSSSSGRESSRERGLISKDLAGFVLFTDEE